MTADSYRWTCPCCGKEKVGLPMDLAYNAPGPWDGLTHEEREASRLDKDFCRIVYPDGQRDHFIRAMMLLPVPALDEDFGFGVWVSVSENSWNAYEEGFDSGEYAIKGCFGYLMHHIPGYEGSYLLHCDVKFQPGNQRPTIHLHEVDHPLVEAQLHGVDVAQVEAWVRPHLTH
jgi:hypothetical protein